MSLSSRTRLSPELVDAPLPRLTGLAGPRALNTPAVVLVSGGLHGLLLAAVALLPPPTAVQIATAPTEMALLEVEQVEPVEHPPEPAPVAPEASPPEASPPEAAPAAPPPRRVHRARAPAPPPPVATAPGNAGDFALDPGQEGGAQGGAPGGTGEGTGDGTASEVAVQPAPAPTGPSRAELRRRVRTYIRGLSDSLAGRVGYPLAARRAHLEGIVVLRVRLAIDGTVLGVRLARSSGHPMLDAAALASLQGVNSLAAPPDGVPWDEHRELPVPIRFRIQ